MVAPPIYRPVAIGPAASGQTPPGPDGTLGYSVVSWCEEWLDHPETDEAWRFTPEQLRFVLWMYALDGDLMRWTDAVLRRAKGWGKDPLAAAISICEWIGPCRFGGRDSSGNAIVEPHPTSLVQIGAVALPQTRNTADVVRAILPMRTIDAYNIVPGTQRWHCGNKQLEVVPTSPKAMEGQRCTFYVAGETQHWTTGNHGIQQARTMRRNLAKSPDGAAHMLSITNAHDPGEDSQARRDYVRFRDGKTSALLYDSLEAPEGLNVDDREQRRIGVAAAVGDSYWVPIDRIVDNEYEGEGTDLVEYLRFYFNQLVAGSGTWLPLDVWKAAERYWSAHNPAANRVAREPDAGRKIAIGFDGSRTLDATGLVGTDLETMYQWQIAVWTRPAHVDEWKVPAHEVNEILDAVVDRYDVVRIYVDPESWDETVSIWAGKYRRNDKTIVVEQRSAGRNLEIARQLREYRLAIALGIVTHEPGGTFELHITNAVKRNMGSFSEDGEQMYLLDKRSEPEKIDLAMCGMYSMWAANDSIQAGALTEEPRAPFSWRFS